MGSSKHGHSVVGAGVVCVYSVSVYRHVHMAEHVHTQRLTLGAWLPYFTHYFWNKLSHWMQTSLVCLGWLITELQGSPWFYPPLAIARITDVCCCTLLLHVCWGSGLRFSCLCKKRFTSQATSLALKPECFQRPTAFMEDSWNLQEYKKSKACPLPWLDCLLLSSLLTFPSSWFIMKDGGKHVGERINVRKTETTDRGQIWQARQRCLLHVLSMPVETLDLPGSAWPLALIELE